MRRVAAVAFVIICTLCPVSMAQPAKPSATAPARPPAYIAAIGRVEANLKVIGKELPPEGATTAQLAIFANDQRDRIAAECNRLAERSAEMSIVVIDVRTKPTLGKSDGTYVVTARIPHSPAIPFSENEKTYLKKWAEHYRAEEADLNSAKAANDAQRASLEKKRAAHEAKRGEGLEKLQESVNRRAPEASISIETDNRVAIEWKRGQEVDVVIEVLSADAYINVRTIGITYGYMCGGNRTLQEYQRSRALKPEEVITPTISLTGRLANVAGPSSRVSKVKGATND